MSAITLAQLDLINDRVKDAVPLVNYGGCGFYATLIQRRLAELDQRTETGVLGYDPPSGADHVFTIITIDGKEYFHDGEETKLFATWVKSDLGRWYSPERLPSDETLGLVNSNRWNPMFDPIGHVHILCGIIEDVLGPYQERPHFNTIQGVRI